METVATVTLVDVTTELPLSWEEVSLKLRESFVSFGEKHYSGRFDVDPEVVRIEVTASRSGLSKRISWHAPKWCAQVRDRKVVARRSYQAADLSRGIRSEFSSLVGWIPPVELVRAREALALSRDQLAPPSVFVVVDQSCSATLALLYGHTRLRVIQLFPLSTPGTSARLVSCDGPHPDVGRPLAAREPRRLGEWRRGTESPPLEKASDLSAIPEEDDDGGASYASYEENQLCASRGTSEYSALLERASDPALTEAERQLAKEQLGRRKRINAVRKKRERDAEAFRRETSKRRRRSRYHTEAEEAARSSASRGGEAPLVLDVDPAEVALAAMQLALAAKQVRLVVGGRRLVLASRACGVLPGTPCVRSVCDNAFLKAVGEVQGWSQGKEPTCAAEWSATVVSALREHAETSTEHRSLKGWLAVAMEQRSSRRAFGLRDQAKHRSSRVHYCQ